MRDQVVQDHVGAALVHPASRIVSEAVEQVENRIGLHAPGVVPCRGVDEEVHPSDQRADHGKLAEGEGHGPEGGGHRQGEESGLHSDHGAVDAGGPA